MGIKDKFLKIWQKSPVVETTDQQSASTEPPKITKIFSKLPQIKLPINEPLYAETVDKKSASTEPPKITKIFSKLPQIKLPINEPPNTERVKEIFYNLQNQLKLPDHQSIGKKLDQSKIFLIEKVFNRFLERVKPEDIELIKSKINQMQKGAITGVWDKVQLLTKMIQDSEVSWQSKALAIATLLYLISPFDAIPDLIPGLGFTDDIALIAAVVASFSHELEKYMVRQAEKKAEIEVQKYHQIVRISLIGSIAAATIAIVVKLILKQIN
jgi:uncharacterized membrane protein YkvA (DUF1232 family)